MGKNSNYQTANMSMPEHFPEEVRGLFCVVDGDALAKRFDQILYS